MGSVWVSAGIVGPVFGGLLADHAHWSLIFWINVPLGLLAVVLSYILLKRLPRHERPHRLDLIGAALLIAGALPLLLALTWGGVRYPWLSLPIAILIAASAVASFAFVWRMRHAPEPFLPMPVLNNPVMRWGTAASAFAQGTAIGLTIFVPLYYELVHRLSASTSGLALIAIVVSTTPGSILSGRVMMVFPRYKWVPLVGLGLAIVALVALSLNPTMSVAGVIAVLAVTGMGIGSTYPVSTVSIQNAVARSEVGVAMGAMNFFRALTAALVVAVMGAIVLIGLGAAPERGAPAGAIAATLAASSLDAAFTFRWVFVAAAVFLFAALLSILAMEERPLRGAIEPVQTPPPGPAE
jgi:MFS family permease